MTDEVKTPVVESPKTEPAPADTPKEESTTSPQSNMWNREGVLTPMDDINYHRMADTLDVSYEDRKIPHVQEKIAFLVDWAKSETKSDDRLTQALAIKDLSRRLGWNIQGKEMITKLHRWAYLDMSRKRIELQQSLLK